MRLLSNILTLSQLVPAILHGYIVTAKREYVAGVMDRYRFEILVKGQPIQELQISDIPGQASPSPCIDQMLLHSMLHEAGYSSHLLDVLEPCRLSDFVHLSKKSEGGIISPVCGVNLWLGMIEREDAMVDNDVFYALPEHEQCPRCRNIIDPHYHPIWRFRDLSYRRLGNKTFKGLPK